MKTLLLLLPFIVTSLISEAQFVARKIINKAHGDSLCVWRGADAWMPSTDANGDLFIDAAMLDDPKFNDYDCIVLSLTEVYTHLPLTDVLRFSNTSDRNGFVNILALNGITALLTDRGDVIISNPVFELLFFTNPEIYTAVIQVAQHIEQDDVIQELAQLGRLVPINFPAQQTPIYNGCN